jgi:hypothetical protein
MERNELILLREEYSNLDPDIAENQKKNKSKVISMRSKPSQMDKVGKDTSKLDKLLYDKQRYFEPGYFCPLTPEELQKNTIDEIDRLLEEK